MKPPLGRGAHLHTTPSRQDLLRALLVSKLETLIPPCGIFGPKPSLVQKKAMMGQVPKDTCWFPTTVCFGVCMRILLAPLRIELIITVFSMDRWHRFPQLAMERISHFQTEALYFPHPVWDKGRGHSHWACATWGRRSIKSVPDPLPSVTSHSVVTYSSKILDYPEKSYSLQIKPCDMQVWYVCMRQKEDWALP